MTILFGHPGGSPFSHNAALAHFEAGRLEAFCIPWMPSRLALRALGSIGPLRPMTERLARRRFAPLETAPKIQGRTAEWWRLAIRACGRGDERLSYQANDWLMRTMAREVGRANVVAVHAYEDCSLHQFEVARGRDKACIYDMPIGYYPAWEEVQRALAERFVDWLPAGGLSSRTFVRPDQKRREMELADLVLVPSSFVERTIRTYHPEKETARASYGVDAKFWSPDAEVRADRPLRFIYAGQLSLRKGIPDLIEAWRKSGLRDAELQLVGPWLLAQEKRRTLPPGVTHVPPLSPERLRNHYRAADVFVFPSYFEGFGLVLTEAMACGLPVIASTATIAADIIDDLCGRLTAPGDVDGLVASLRWFAEHRDRLRAMSHAARQRAEQLTWQRYRAAVAAAVAPFV